MPIYEYRCKNCQHKFEKLVRMSTPDEEIECPACHTHQVEKVPSLFGAKSAGRASFSSSPSCAPAPGGG